MDIIDAHLQLLLPCAHLTLLKLQTSSTCGLDESEDSAKLGFRVLKQYSSGVVVSESLDRA